MPNSIAENVLGTAGTICWTGQLIPQVWKSYREKSTKGLSPWLLLIWGFATVFMGAYAFLQRLNIPLMLQPQLFGFLSLVCWGQCQYYGLGCSRIKSLILTIICMAVTGIIEFLLVFFLRPTHEKGNHVPASILGVLASVIIIIGFFPQYWEIFKCKRVMGISMVFISIDMLGGVLNTLSLAFKDHFDVIASLSFLAVVLFDGFIVLAALILNPRARRRSQQENAGQDCLEAPTVEGNAIHENNRLTPPGSPSRHPSTVPISITTTVETEPMEEGRHI
ncbi:PQ loop repeat-domain-containing protein [Panaeolus papilionaceus]|nr:PQ loop repeat-domain-containing protein [Panaeolus papilionaceus]